MSDRFQQIIDAVDGDRVIELARAALRIPSLSGEEQEVAEMFAHTMSEIGLDSRVQLVPPFPNMPGPSANALGRLKGSGGGVSVLFNGHIDHNPVSDGWTKDPFGGIVEDGWLYGFVHMKAACACYIMAVDAIRQAGVTIKGDVEIALVCGELRGGAGTQYALAQGLTADYFVLGEPTELQTATRHTASIVVDLHILGRTKHFATEDASGHKGVNAVEKSALVIAALGASHRPLPSRAAGGWLTFEPAPGFEGLPQFNIGSVRGGISRTYDRSRPALMPDRCTVTVDIRVVPGMDKDSIMQDLTQLLDDIARGDPDFAYELEFASDTFPHPFNSPEDSPVATAIGRAHKRVTGQPAAESKILRFAASDASWMAKAGIPGIVYGPTGRYLSRPDERGRIEDLVTATKVYSCLIADLCSPDQHNGV